MKDNIYLFQGFILLAACILIGQQASAYNDVPCQPSINNNAHDTFLRRHAPPGSPTTNDQNSWQKFIEKRKELCKRPVQSFIPNEEREKLIAVCSAAGGKVYEKNLCISKEDFTFFTVRVDKKCVVTNVQQETKRLILACDKVDNKCVPVHFEANARNVKPKDNALDCTA
uniref:Uncharacterized protein n=1 Tax=Oryzias latipes TaxID=8090 RepID=A0A3P9JFV0_ORYLA